MKENGRIKTPDLFIGDFLNFLLSLLPSLLSYCLTLMTSQDLFLSKMGSWGLLVAVPLCVVYFLVIVFAFRLFLPKLKPGISPVGLNWKFVVWSMHVFLARAVELFVFKKVIFAFNTFRFLLFRALGAKVPFNMVCSLNVSLVDYPLIEIGDDVTLTEGVTLSCHTVVKNKLWLKKLVIERNSYIGMNTIIGLGSKIGENSVVGPYNIIMADNLPAGTELVAFEWHKGNPEKHHNKKSTQSET